MKVVSGNFGKEKIHFEAPSAGRVPHEMEEFLTWLNGNTHLDLVAKEMVKAEDSGKKTNYLIISPKNIRIPKIHAEKTPGLNQ